MGWPVFESASTDERVRHHATTAGDESGARRLLPVYLSISFLCRRCPVLNISYLITQQT
ncbi:hypothetical protein SAM19_03713 [Brevibacillus laterosporus]|nr:hypothetical protein [Brevibacillus laterosporus]